MEDVKKQEDVKVEDTKKVDETKQEDKQTEKPSFADILNDEEYNKQLQSMMDKRVTDALKKREKQLKDEFEAEKKLSQMTDDERKQEEDKARELEQKKRERELTVRELKLELVNILEKAELDTSFRDMIDVTSVLGLADNEARVKELGAKVDKLKGTFSTIIEKKVEEVKKEYLKGTSPQNLGKEKNNTPLNDYDKAKKNKDTKAMIGHKFAQRK